MNMTIGFIGLGNIGGRMAKKLGEAGYSVRGYDIRSERARELGLSPAASIAEACEADVVLLSLPDSGIIEQVVLGAAGIREAARPELAVVDLSTADPTSTRKLHALLAERGVHYLDAAVSGGPVAAEAGTLTLMVGGPSTVLERVRPVLEVLGKRIYHMGGSGNGHVAKAVNNFLNGMSLAATAEAMIVGVRAGLDPALLLEVLNASSGRSFATEFRFPRILKGDYIEGGISNALQAKDLDVYNALGRQVKVPTLLGETCRAVYSIAIARGYGERVANTIVDLLGDLAGGVKVQQGFGHAPEKA